MREDEPEARAMLPATIPWKLLQGIALVQLYPTISPPCSVFWIWSVSTRWRRRTR